MKHRAGKKGQNGKKPIFYDIFIFILVKNQRRNEDIIKYLYITSLSN